MSIPKFNAKWKAPSAIKESKDKGHLGWKWWRIRKAYLRQKPYCERCGLPADHVHHIIPRSVDPTRTYDWSNLMSLCLDCHNKEHNMGRGDLFSGNPQLNTQCLKGYDKGIDEPKGCNGGTQDCACDQNHQNFS